MASSSSAFHWVPLRIHCPTKDAQNEVLAALPESITAAVDDSEVYVYGQSTDELLHLSADSSLKFEKQALLCYRVDSISTPQAAVEAEKLLICCPNVNAAVADPSSGLVYVFIDDAFGRIRDPQMAVTVSLTLSWSRFAFNHGQQVDGNQEEPQHIGVYPEYATPADLEALKDTLNVSIPSVEIQVSHCPPALLLDFHQGLGSGENVCTLLAETLHALGNTNTRLGAGRIALWQCGEEQELCCSTVLHRTSAPVPLGASTAELRSLQRNLETLLAGAKLQVTRQLFFRLGMSECSVWQLPQRLKSALQHLQRYISGIYLNFTATHLIVITDDAEKVSEEVPAALARLGFPGGRPVPPPAPSAEELMSETAWGADLPCRPPPAAELMVTAVQPTGCPTTARLKEYALLHTGLTDALVDVESGTCYLQHVDTLPPTKIQDILQSLNCEARLLPGNQLEPYEALLRRQPGPPAANGVEVAAEAPPSPLSPELGPGQSELPNDLEDKWAFYFDAADSGKLPSAQFQDQLKEVGTFDTLQHFWLYWGSFQVANMKEGFNLRLFRYGIKPMWEDPANREGGKWVTRGLPPRERGRLWPMVALAMVQGLLRGDAREVVCGLVMSTKAGSDTMQVWCGNKFDPKGAEDKVTVGTILEKLVSTDPSDRHVFIYQPHAGKPKATPAPATQHEKSKSSAWKKEEVRLWLMSINLEEYYESFIADGYDDMRSIAALDEADLSELGLKKGHKKRFLAARDKYLESHQEPVPKPKPRQEPRAAEEKAGIAGNWREGPTKTVIRDAAPPATEKPKALARREDAYAAGKGAGYKRPETMPVYGSPAAPAPSRVASLPATAGGMTALQQLQYLAQLQQLQQAGMLGPLMGFGGGAGAAAAAYGAYGGGGYNTTDWAALLAGMASQARAPSAPSSSPPSSTSASPPPAPAGAGKASTFKLNPQAAAFKPARPTAQPSSAPPPERDKS